MVTKLTQETKKALPELAQEEHEYLSHYNGVESKKGLLSEYNLTNCQTSPQQVSQKSLSLLWYLGQMSPI